ncbi:hypothetical protein LCGC14_1300570 [marine sediment metagenome]|uniref:Uncharacterized protein n=1 Tax=marine sediment metagenome TaxID=412755 RepID=A0A0F9KQ64_9ZZZZ
MKDTDIQQMLRFWGVTYALGSIIIVAVPLYISIRYGLALDLLGFMLYLCLVVLWAIASIVTSLAGLFSYKLFRKSLWRPK